MATQDSEQDATGVELDAIKQRFLQVTRHHGWTTQLEIAAKLGVHERTISSICTAERMIGTRTLLAMIKHELDIVYVLTGKQAKTDAMAISTLEQRVAVLESTLKNIMLIAHQVVPNNKLLPAKLQMQEPDEPPQPKLTPEQLLIIAKYEKAPVQIQAALNAMLSSIQLDSSEETKSG